MAMNLRLGLCPKCFDTKNVEKCETVICIPTTTQYRCKECKIKWWTSSGTNFSNVSGTIEEEKPQFPVV